MMVGDDKNNRIGKQTARFGNSSQFAFIGKIKTACWLP